MVRGFRSLKLTQEPRPCQLLGYHIVNDRTTCCTCGLCSAPNCRDPPEGLQETLFIGLVTVFFGRISALEDSGSHIYLSRLYLHFNVNYFYANWAHHVEESAQGVVILIMNKR